MITALNRSCFYERYGFKIFHGWCGEAFWDGFLKGDLIVHSFLANILQTKFFKNDDPKLLKIANWAQIHPTQNLAGLSHLPEICKFFFVADGRIEEVGGRLFWD